MLAQLQQNLQAYLLNQDRAIEEQVVSTARVSAAERLSIYATAYRYRLRDCLAATYAALHQILGDDLFTDLSASYLAQHPSSFRSVRWFGDQLPSFLQQATPYQEVPILAELAAFEWGLSLAFDALDAPILTLNDLATISPNDWEHLCLTLHPAVQRFDFHYNTIAVWQACDTGEEPPLPAASSDTVPWVLWRQDFKSHFVSLSSTEAMAFDAVIAGRSVGELCMDLCEWIAPEQVSLTVISMLKGWVVNGLVSRVTVLHPVTYQNE